MRRNSEAGQALWVTAAALTVLMGFAGLGIDMGVMRYEKRVQQSAADAAAIAGASNLSYGGVQSGAQDAAASNSFTDNTGGGACAAPPTNLAVGSVTVTVCNGPSTGPHAGNANYVEAFVSAGHPTYFMRMFGINSETITARAVATNLGGASEGGCLYTLGPPSSSIEGVNINGSAVLNAPNCGILDNGNFNTKGNKLIVDAATFGTSGDWNKSGPGGTVTCEMTPTNCPAQGIPAATDPIPTMTPPCTTCTGGSSISIDGKSSSCGTGCSFGNGIYTISPGTYSSITISGTGSGSSVFFQPGVYIIDGSGGLSQTGNGNLHGGAVTFYFANNATVSITGTPTVTLTAPGPTGAYPGILMWQAASDTNTGPFPNGPTLGGNSGSSYNGVLYFPSDQLTFYGNNNTIAAGIVVTQSLALSGNPTVNLNGNADMPSGVNLIKDAILVE